MILFETSLGDFKIAFFEKEAPLSVANFLKYIEADSSTAPSSTGSCPASSFRAAASRKI